MINCVNKAVVLAGGRGIRMNNYDDNLLPKTLMRINNQPIINNILKIIVDLEISELIIVVGYKKDLLINYITENKTALKLNNINLKFLENPYINEKSKSGLATAVALAEQYIDNNFLVMLGDEIYYNSKHKEMLEYYKNSNFDGLIGYKIIDDKDAIKKNYSLKFNDKSQIIELIEKPEIIENNFLGCGTYIFKKDFFEFLKNCPVSKRTGKCELADSIMLYIQSGAIIGGFDLNGYYMNINYIADLAAAQEYAKKIEI